MSYPQYKFKPGLEITEAPLADAPETSAEPAIRLAAKSHWMSAVAFWLIIFGLVGTVGYWVGLLATIAGLAVIVGLLVLFGVWVINNTVEL